MRWQRFGTTDEVNLTKKILNRWKWFVETTISRGFVRWRTETRFGTKYEVNLTRKIHNRWKWFVEKTIKNTTVSQWRHLKTVAFQAGMMKLPRGKEALKAWEEWQP